MKKKNTPEMERWNNFHEVIILESSCMESEPGEEFERGGISIRRDKRAYRWEVHTITLKTD
jgi:hypothetical protein